MTTKKPERAPRIYSVGLVGEQHYSAAAGSMVVGEQVWIRHEASNRADRDALVCLDEYGSTLGYIPRDNFLQRTFHEEGKGCAAVVQTLTRKGKRTDIVLAVTLCPLDHPENCMLEPDQKTPREGQAPAGIDSQTIVRALLVLLAISVLWKIFG